MAKAYVPSRISPKDILKISIAISGTVPNLEVSDIIYQAYDSRLNFRGCVPYGF
jgi:hypothetical protein